MRSSAPLVGTLLTGFMLSLIFLGVTMGWWVPPPAKAVGLLTLALFLGLLCALVEFLRKGKAKS